MTDNFQLLMQHGYLIIFFSALGERIGFPLLLTPFMVTAGALAGYGRISFTLIILLTILAFLMGDLLWYELGRRKGVPVLRLLCRLSLEPDSCVRRSQNIMGKHAEYSLLYAKFLPGVGRVVPPVCGMSGMPLAQFIPFSVAGSLLWALAIALIGYLPARQIATTQLAEGALLWLLVSGLLAVAGNLVWKLWNRRRFLRSLRVARIEPAEVKLRLERHEDLMVVDLRHPLDFLHDPRVIPGAVHITPEELESRHAELPKARDLILYCT